jgi:dipeptidyl aminopeptidase/acylaminoacyl peptidase
MTESATIERVHLTSRNGARLAGVLHRPRDVGLAGRSAVVLCHGMESTKDGTKHRALAAELETRGYVVLRFDFSFVGESSGRFQDLTIGGEVEDLGGACDWLWRHGTTAIGLIGSSLGGTVAVLFAGAEPRVRALVTIAALSRPLGIVERLGPTRVAEWRRSGVRQESSGVLGRAFLDELAGLDVLGAAARLSAATLVTHGDRDDVVPVADAHALYAALPEPKALAITRGCDHRYSEPAHLAGLLAHAVEWIARHLEPGRARAGSSADEPHGTGPSAGTPR